jgi:hypothetical protein
MKNAIYTRMVLAMGLIMLVLAGLHAGNERTSARLIGMAGSNSAALGIDAIGVNPAFLAVPYGSRIEIAILPVGARFGSNFMDYSLYTSYFTGVADPVTGERTARHLTDADKNTILGSFPRDMGKINMDARILWIGAAIRYNFAGTFAVSVSDRVAGNLHLPNDYLRMMFMGFSESGSSYDFGGTDVRSWWIREYSIAYATPRMRIVDRLQWVSFGGGIKHVAGFAYFDTETYEATLSNLDFTNRFVLNGNVNIATRRASADFIHDPDRHGFTPLRNPAGTGWGVDLGIAAGITSSLTGGLAMTDLGVVRWNRNTYGSVSSGSVVIDDLMSSAQRDSLENAYAGRDGRIGAFTTALPAALRAGARMTINTSLLVAAEYTQGLNNMPSNSPVPRLSAGAEWRPTASMPLRSGFTIGGHQGFAWAFGFGVNASRFDFDIATENIGVFMYPNRSKHASVAMGMKFRL